MGMRYKPDSLNPRQLGQMDEEELFIDQLNTELENTPDYEQPPIAAQPMTDEELSEYDGVQLSPDVSKQTFPSDIAAQPPALKIPQPQLNEQPARPSSQPGTTAAVSAITEDELPSTKPESEPDEYEKLFSDYGKARQQYERDISEFEKESAEGESKSQLMTGIAGALQAFGEGLAAITGGSAKPVQTGAATLRSIGEQQAAARERKGKTLKERLQMAKEPLETKAEEIKFRDVFEQRQKTKRLEDPTSKESKQARELATNFLDAYTASVSNRVDNTQLAKIEAIKPRLENLNANQIKDFMDNLNKLKFTESRVDIEEAKGERAAKQQESKTAASQEFKVQQDAQKSIVKVESELEQDQKFYDQYKQFRSNLQKAIAGDPDAQRFIKNNMDAFTYMKGRTLESKGVFTDQDAERLTTLLKDRTWFEKFQAWLAGGLQGEIPMDVLKSLDAALKDEPKNPILIKNQKLKRLANIAKKSTNSALQNSASYYESVMEKEPEAQSAQTKLTETQTPIAKPIQKYNSVQDLKDAINKGKKFNDGDILKIGNTNFKMGPNGKLRKM